MMHRLPTWPVAVLLTLLLLSPGCAPSEDGAVDLSPAGDGMPEETAAGTAEPLAGTETLEEGGFEMVAVEPELTRTEERGLMLYRHYCAHCHGPSGAGDGQNSFGLETPPRDLLAYEMDERTDDQLRRVITDGGAANGFSRLMPPWGNTIEARHIDDLVALIRVLPDLEGLEEEPDVPSLDEGGDELTDFSL